MKTKPKRHKSLNTFKFQTFSERISNIDINVFHKIKHPYEEDDKEENIYYWQCFFKWKNQNFSQNYVELFEKLPHDVNSLPQLLAQKDQIINILIEHIRFCDVETLQPALELITAFAKDLRKEFYPYFNPGILRECVRLLDTREPDQIEWVFTCLAHLFKYLWSPIIKNIDSVLPELLPLLSNSKPRYINNFAAESFAFVARKVRDKSQFLSLSLKNVRSNPDELFGVAKLFFEVMKSVGDQFHSGAVEFMIILLRALDNRKWSKLLFMIWENLCKHLITFISKKTEVSPLWNSFMKVINEFYLEWQTNYDDHNSENLHMLLKLIERFIMSRDVILRNSAELMNLMLKLGLNSNIKSQKELHTIVIDIISQLLIHQHFSFMIKSTNDIAIQVLNNIQEPELVVRFVEKIVCIPQYEMLIFKEFLKIVHTIGLNYFLTQFLAKVIYMKTKFLLNEDNERNLHFYSTSLESVPESFLQYLLNTISEHSSQDVTNKAEKILYSILILSYVKKSHSSLISQVDKFVTILCDAVSSAENVEYIAKLMFILLMIIQYRVKYFSSISFDYNSVFKLAIKFVKSNNYLCSIRLLEISSSYILEYFDEDSKLYLIDNLNSPFHKVRLFSSRVLSKLNIHPVFEHILTIESIEPSIETYRDKLKCLQKFEYNELFTDYVSNKLAEIGVVKFLLGNLYINFQFLWEPVQRLVTSHLENNPDIWKTFEDQLNNAVINDANSAKLLENFVVSFDCEFLQKHFYDLNGVDDRPDFLNFRSLMLQILTNIKNYNFTHENFMPELFLKFYDSEYTASYSEFNSLCNITKLEKVCSNNEMEDDFNINCHEANKLQSRNLNKLFILHLKIISNASNEISQEVKSKIFDVHFDLLANRNSEIQQLAVKYVCLKKGLNAYKDRLILLTKDNTFKDELMNLRIDFNADIFPEQHKLYFIKIVLKIMYGKLRKKSSHLRDSIFEFLAGCAENEIFSFFDMIFKQIKISVKDSIENILANEKEINLEKTISPACLSSYINTVLELFKRCSKLLKPSNLSYLLKIILKIVAHLNAISSKKCEVHAGYYGLMNKIRITSFETIIYFFENFEYYPWTEEVISAVLKLFIEPRIEKVPEECLQSPNPVMKLFIVFTNNPRYFPFLVTKHKNVCAMDVIMSLLDSEKVYFNVKNSVVELIERLLTLDDDDDSDENKISDLLYLDTVTEKPIKTNQQYGIILLKPYISTILGYLQKSLAKKYIRLDAVYMLILKKISDFGLDEGACVGLLTLLMPILRSKAVSEDDTLLQLLDTIVNLFKSFKNYSNFENYLLEIAHIFGIVTASPVRKLLCDLLRHISQKTGKTLIDAELITGLNLFNIRWLDQPDYAGRLDAFKRINESSKNDEINLYTGVFIIYNCFYMVKMEKDLALRDHSGLCLQKLCVSLCEKYNKSSKQLDTLLNIVLLPLIKEGVQSENENYQQESVVLLGHLVRECDTFHPVFKHLHPLGDKNDLENDFFENIQHLQHYRRIKALRRFSDVMSKETKLPLPYSLMFISPLISQYVLSTKYASEHGLINSAIDALKVICFLSPWRHYERILKQYLLEMRKNVVLRKQGIRVISVILDSFHFDLSQADIAPKKLDKKNIRRSDDADDIEINEEMEIDENDDAEDIKNNAELSQLVVKKVIVLCPSDATRVYRSIKSFLIPSLNRVFMTYEDSDQYHKLSKKETLNNEKEELAVLSIPIAYAIVKLLKQLPCKLLDEYISVVFLKLSTYLKSRLMSIRLVARETMQNILMEVGPKYLPKLISEMISILNKGFQIHVLVFTCHAVLEKIKPLFNRGDIDSCIDPVLEICIVDLFGKLSEEKEVAKISNKTPEAKGNKSYNMLNILAECITQSHILDLVLPLKEIINNNLSSRVVTKVRRCLKYIVLGLTRNQYITPESLLVFAYGVSNDCIPSLTAENENNKVRLDPEPPIQKPDTFLIAEEPRHMKAETSKSCARTNAHVIIEFGLELLESMLKREIVKQAFYRPHLDPFAPLIKDCLQSQHIKLTIISLKSLIYLLKRDLPSLNENVPEISDSIFTILGKNSSARVSGEYAELLMAATKVALVLVRDLKHTINNDQLRILLFVSEDLQNNVSHYGTGFSLLRAIIGRKYNIPEFHQLMKKIAEMSIRSYSDSVRTMARKAFYQYFMDYPLGKNLRQYVLFYTSQLKYDELFGRKSALEMLTVLVKIFPLEKLSELSTMLYVQLSFRLILDESPECKRMAADCICNIISRLQNTKEGKILFDITLIWLKEKKIANRRLAIQLLELFVSTEKKDFSSKFSSILPELENQLHDGSFDGPGKYVKAPVQSESENFTSEKDHLFFQVLQLYKVLFESCPVLLNDASHSNYVRRIGECCQLLLRHSHEWVRLGATEVLGIIFKSLNISEITSVLNNLELTSNSSYLRDEQVKAQIKSLCLDFCDQLAPGYDVMEQLLRQTMKNLLFLAEVLRDVKCVDAKNNLSLLWLVRRLVKQVNLEVSHTPQKYTVRTMIFNWFAALIVKLEEDTFESILPYVLQPLIRELSTNDTQGVTIRRMAKEVLNHYRQKVNRKYYDEVVIKVRRILDIKRTKRKTLLAQMAVIDPEQAAKRKIKVQLKKKEQKKRRLERLRKKKFKSGKKKRIEIKND